MEPEAWGLERDERGVLIWEGHDLPDLAREYGTPLHVASAAKLRATAARWTSAFAGHSAPVSIHFSYKTNAVAGILQVLHAAGLGAEVVGAHELLLAQRLGVAPDGIVFNGPNKTDDEIRAAVDAGIGLLVADHLYEIDRIATIADELGKQVRLGLRVCPDVVPRWMNTSSLTGSRKQQFGLDRPSGEWAEALDRVRRSRRLELRAVMAHIGSGIHDLPAFRTQVETLLDCMVEARQAGLDPTWLDIGGGLGTPLSREFTTLEMLAYLGVGWLPGERSPGPDDLVERYAAQVCKAVVDGSRARGLDVPGLFLEPGRAMTSDAQVLLLRVGTVRERPGVGKFALVDGGAMTVSMMFLSELHAVLLANRHAPNEGRTNVFGALPSPMDVVYRNLPLPELVPGDLLAVMDAGAYFTSTATNFGGPRPGVVLLDGEARRIRRPETSEDLLRVETVLD